MTKPAYCNDNLILVGISLIYMFWITAAFYINAAVSEIYFFIAVFFKIWVYMWNLFVNIFMVFHQDYNSRHTISLFWETFLTCLTIFLLDLVGLFYYLNNFHCMNNPLVWFTFYKLIYVLKNCCTVHPGNWFLNIPFFVSSIQDLL